MLLVTIVCKTKGETIYSLTPQKDTSKYLIAYPVVFYFPETSLGFGGGGLYTFKAGSSQTNQTSNLQLGIGYTLNKQLLLFFGFNIFTHNNRRVLNGEIGYYDYFYPFYGIGSTSNPIDKESYFVTFPRVKVKYLIGLDQHHRLGPSLHYDYYRITKIEAEGILDQGSIVGSSGGSVAGLGFAYQFDNRNIQFYPSQGSFIDASWHFYNQSFISDFTFSKLTASYSQYFTLRKALTLATNIYVNLTTGSPPFQELAQYGGPKYARGFVIGRFVDKHQGVVQAELRHPLFWRLSLHAFGSLGNVFSDINQVTELPKWNAGVGLRFLLDKDDLLNLRVDYGFSNEGGELYLTIGEAF